MASKKGKQVKTKIKKKLWLPIVAPSIFNNAILGETHISEHDQVLRKSVTLNLGTVLNDMRKQSYMVRFDVTEIKEGKARSALVGLTMTPNGVKRLIRRGRSKIDDSFLVKLKTGQIVRIKPVVITINLCSKDAQSTIRLAVREKLKQILATSTIESFVKEILENKVQRVLKEVSNKSHPTKSVDVRSIVLLPKEKVNLAALSTEEDVVIVDKTQKRPSTKPVAKESVSEVVPSQEAATKTAKLDSDAEKKIEEE